jgi:hypothetical protein
MSALALLLAAAAPVLSAPSEVRVAETDPVARVP